MSQYCSKCGTHLAGDEAFCQNCGAKVDVEQQVSEQAAEQTPPQPPQQVQPMPQQPYVQPVPKKKGLGTGAIIGIVAGAVVVVAALLLVLLGVFGGGGNTVTSIEDDVSDIEGKWYSSSVMIDFDDDGTLKIETGGEEYDGEYTYDADDEQGEIKSDLGDFDGVTFKLRSSYLKIGDDKYYRDKEEAGYGQQTFAGLWHAVEATLSGQTEDIAFMGMAFEFNADGGVVQYEEFARSETGTWEELKSGSLKLTSEDNDVVTLENIAMDADGQAFTADMTSDGIRGSMSFVKTDMDTFLAQKNDLLLNNMLLKMQGFWWMCGAEGYPPVSNEVLEAGLAIEFKAQMISFYLEYTVDAANIDFEFTDKDTIHYIKDGDEFTVVVGFETIGEQEYLTMTADGSKRYFIRSSEAEYMAVPSEPTVLTQPAVDTTYKSDEDIRALLAREWNVLHKLEVDGSINVNIENETYRFYSDGRLENMFQENIETGRWSVENGRVACVLEDGTEFGWPVFIEYKADAQEYWLYMEMDNYEPGSYFVFTDSAGGTSAPAPDTTEFGSLEEASWRSQGLFEQAMMDGAWQYAGTVDYPIVMNVPEYADFTPDVGRILQFGTDDMLSATYMDGSDDESGEYGFGGYCAYIVIDSYDAPDEEYEVNVHYYITTDGNLVETIRMYSYDRDEFFAVSNANVYVPYQP